MKFASNKVTIKLMAFTWNNPNGYSSWKQLDLSNNVRETTYLSNKLRVEFTYFLKLGKLQTLLGLCCNNSSLKSFRDVIILPCLNSLKSTTETMTLDS